MLKGMMRHVIDFIQMAVIWLGILKFGDLLQLNGAGESIVLKNLLVLAGIVAFIVKIILMVKNKKAE